MSLSRPTDRFHALDATRAFALMLGVLFHAVYSFVPQSAGAPIVDVAGNRFFDWVFFALHSFRMQVFFLIAGFFARMLYQKRGWVGFVRHRLVRIGLPLVVGWFILHPLVLTTWIWGANLSGRNLIELPIPFLFQLLYEHRLMFVPEAQGGLFNLVHLWFLYYLLWLYLVALVVRFLVTRALPASGGWRTQVDRVVAHVARSPWAIVWLTGITGLFLWAMEGWTGVDTPVGQLTPAAPVLVLYGSFFLLGLLMHRQARLVQELGRNWKWQVGAGLAVSLGCFAWLGNLVSSGYTTGTLFDHYPNLTAGQVSDWRKFAATLQASNNPASVRPELANFWQHLPEPARTAIMHLPANPSPDRKTGVCEAINKALITPEPFAAGAPPVEGIPTAAEAAARLTRHRAVLDDLFAGAVLGDPLKLPSYSVLKLGFALGYALMMWLLVFGSIGCFQAVFHAHSAAWRYVADSSYWIYLLHLPLVAFLQVWMGAWNWPALVKVPLLLGIAFVILFATYHYLVRSTFLGQLLNGQRFAFTPWPLAVDRTAKPRPMGLPVPPPTSEKFAIGVTGTPAPTKSARQP